MKNFKKVTKAEEYNPLTFLDGRVKIRDLNDLICTDDAQQLLALSRREEEGRAKQRQPNMTDSEGDEVGSQIGDNITINVVSPDEEPTPVAPVAKAASGLAKAGILALAAGTGVGLPIGIGLSMLGGDTTTTTVVEENLNPESLRLGPPLVKTNTQNNVPPN